MVVVFFDFGWVCIVEKWVDVLGGVFFVFIYKICDLWVFN